MLRTYIMSFGIVEQGDIKDVPAENITQITLLAESMNDAKQRIIDAMDQNDVPLVQWTDQCKELSEGTLFVTLFEWEEVLPG